MKGNITDGSNVLYTSDHVELRNALTELGWVQSTESEELTVMPEGDFLTVVNALYDRLTFVDIAPGESFAGLYYLGSRFMDGRQWESNFIW